MSEIVKNLIIAVVAFLLFGWITLMIGSYDWLEPIKIGLLGACLALLIFRVSPSSDEQQPQ